MSNVLPFPHARIEGRAKQSNAVMMTAQSATILFFTGVRYERHIDDAPQNVAPESLGGDNHHATRRRRQRRRA
jgi:hypothetical protein